MTASDAGVRVCSLRFNDQPFEKTELDPLLTTFREQGYVVLPNVFERDSVDAYLEDILNKPGVNEAAKLWPASACRVRQALGPALSHSEMMARKPILYQMTWHIPDASESTKNQEWHVDLDPEAPPSPGYHFPREVHAGMYFRDMDSAGGPTEVVPGSHVDRQRLPNKKSVKAKFLCRKEDAILWDQRLWHRSTARTLPGPRVFAVFGFFAAPGGLHRPVAMPNAQRAAWLEASDREEQIFYGGPFLPPKDS